jgi:alpha-tubulin suppressor-like RCC1 family protein
VLRAGERARPIAGLVLAIGFFISGVGCGSGGGAAGDGGVPDAPADRASRDGADSRADTEPSPDAPPPVPCDDGRACPPDQFCAASGVCLSAVKQVAAGAHHSCALHRDGRVSCWGMAESINAGGGALVPPSFVPGLHGVRAISAGTHQTCAITGDRGVRCWGNQAFPVLREGGSPLAEVSALAVGVGVACAGNPQGTFCWGKNDQGQLARPPEVTSSAPALLADPSTAPAFLGAGFAIIGHDGNDRICLWGHNGTHLVTASDDVNIYRSPVCGRLPDVMELVVGADHACVRHAAGSFSCWGERYYGQLGLGAGPDQTVDVPPFGRVTSVASAVVGMAAGASHTCLRLQDGQVGCFGLNSRGQVGPSPQSPGEEVRSFSPVGPFPAPVVEVAAGASAQHTCALLADGTVSCWGNNHAGQLGDRPTTLDQTRFSARPVAVRW